MRPSLFSNRLLVSFLVGVLALCWWYFGRATSEPVQVGILHSFTGPLAGSERAVADTTLLAIEEINSSGGLLGRTIEPVIADGESDEDAFAREAERLITSAGVSTLFGCWTSASRKAVRSVVERLDHLLVYPMQYEGLESSPNILYVGAAPNQQIVPAVKWSFDNLGKRMFLVGSDYIFPRMAAELIKDQLAALQGELVGEEYLPLESMDVELVVDRIRLTRPDVVLNTINGTTNAAFFRALREAGITPSDSPTMSFSIAEVELRDWNLSGMEGEYAAWNYFQSLETEENREFVARFRERYGQDRVVSDPMEAAYIGVHLWAQAVRDAGSFEPRKIRAALGDQSYAAPGGLVYVDRFSQHLWKTVRIGKIQAEGQFEIVWSSQRPVRPIPFPTYRSASEWEALLVKFYRGWGNRWSSQEKERGSSQPL